MQIYSDEMGSIAVTGPIVRIDLMVQSIRDHSPDGKPTLVVQQQLVMPIDAFLRAAMRMQNVVQDFEKKGLIKKAPTAGDKTTLVGRVTKTKQPPDE